MVTEKQKKMIDFIKKLVNYEIIDNYGYTTATGLSLFLDKTGEEVRRLVQIYSQDGSESSVNDVLNNPNDEYQILIFMPTDNKFKSPIDDWRWGGDSLGMYAIPDNEIYETLEKYLEFLDTPSDDDLARAAALIDDDDDFIV